MGTMEETFNRILDPSLTSRKKRKEHQPEFLPSAAYVGSKPGYVFRTSELGTGYHLDDINHQTETSRSATVAISPADVAANDSEVAKRKKTPEELLEEAEKAVVSASSTATLDQLGVSHMSAALSKAYEKNQLQRSEFADEPEKYMNSEVDLHDALKAIQNVAAAPTLYKYLYGKQTTSLLPHQQQGAVRILTQCFTHPNIDILIVLLQTWNELLDIDLISLEHDDEQKRIVQESIGFLGYSLIVNQGIEALCSTLTQLESNDYDDDFTYKEGVEGVLKLMETLLEADALGIFRGIHFSNEGSGDSNGQPLYLSVIHRIWKSTPTFITWLLNQVADYAENSLGSSSTTKKPSHTLDMQQIALSSSDLLATIFQHEDGVPFISQLTAMPAMESLPPDNSNFHNEVDRKTTTKNDKKGQGSVDGIDALLRAIAPYRKRDPLDETECEHLENIFDALAATLLHGSKIILQSFVDLQGIELMLRLLSSKGHAGSGALRVLNFCLSGAELSDEGDRLNGADSAGQLYSKDRGNSSLEMACAHFVDAGGLKLLFPILMGNSLPKPATCTDAGRIVPSTTTSRSNNVKKVKTVKHAKKEWANQVKMNIVYILYALSRYLRDNSPYDAKPRLLAKLAESDCEKCDRLVELFLKCDKRVRLAEAKYFRSDEADFADERGIDAELGAFHAKLRGGGDMFHRLSAILAFAAVGSKKCHARIIEQLQLNNSGISVVKSALQEFLGIVYDPYQQSQLREYISFI